MKKLIILILFNVIIISMLSGLVLAAQYVGTFDSFIVDTDFSDSTYVASSTPRAVYLHTYPINTQRVWYSLYVTASDPVAQTCTIDMQEQNVISSGGVTIGNNEVYKFLENSLDYQYIGVSGFTAGGTCRVAYGFENTNFDNTSDSNQEPEENTQTTGQCLDSDGGIKQFVQGTMTHLYTEESITTEQTLQSPITDYCLNPDTLVEHFCADGLYGPDGQTFIHQDTIDCVNGCSEGACIEEIDDDLEEKTTTGQCLDSDGGVKYFEQGTMTHFYTENSITTNQNLESPITDYCLDPDTLVEHFCADGLYGTDGQTFIHQDAIECENGCNQGACIEEEEKNTNDKGNNKKSNPLSGFVKFIFKLFDGFFGNEKTEIPVDEIQEAQNILIWQVNSDLQNVLEPGIIRAFDAGSFETDLTCPEGMLLSTLEVAKERYLGKPHMYGITLYCAPPGINTVLDTNTLTTVGWGTNLNNGGFENEPERVINGLRGFYTTAGPLEFIKKLEAQKHYIAQDSEEIILDEFLNQWVEVPEALSITTSANNEAFCTSHGLGTVTGVSGLRIYSIERNNKDIVSGLQLKCSTLEQVNLFI
jgi:hypothetical protein